MSNPIGLPAREAALQVLQEHEQSGTFLKDLFPRLLASLNPKDQALARTLALGILRNRSLLDHHLDKLAPKGITQAGLRAILRLGAFQILLLNGIPVHSAVDTSVELARLKFGKPLAGFVNALLKNLAQQGLKIPKGDDPQGMSVATSHPEWLVRRWCLALGRPAAAQALQRNNQEPSVWLRVNPLHGTVEEAQRVLTEAGLTVHADPLAPLFLRLNRGSDEVLRLALFTSGGLSFQDPAAYFVGQLLQWQPGLSALDLCAAPGGKSALLLEMALAAGQSLQQSAIVCADSHERRLRLIQDAQIRLGHHGGRGGTLLPVVQNALQPALKTRFDRVLADVPCSNLGVIGRRPEARWRLRESELAEQGKRQLALLHKAADLVAPGGRLVYATCSPEPEETSRVLAAFLNSQSNPNAYTLVDAATLLPANLVRQSCLHLYPGETDYDGFFAAALQKAG